jgi:protein TonB
VRRHITLPIGTLEETIHVTCSSTDRATRPSAPTAATTPGTAARKAAPSGTEPKIPATFTGGIGGQIKVPMKVSHTNPICPSGVTTDSAVVRLAGRIGIDGLFTDPRDVGSNADPAYVASALEAVRQWVFTPTLLNGAPIEVNINVTVSYGR